MTTAETVSLIIAIIGAVVGLASLAWAIVSFFKSAKLNEKLEDIKRENEIKVAIATNLIGREFDSTDEILNSLEDLISKVLYLFPFGLYCEDSREEEKLKERAKRHVIAYEAFEKFDCLYNSKIAYVDNDLSNSIKELKDLCVTQINMFPDLMLKKGTWDLEKEHSKQRSECFKRSSSIIEKNNSLIREFKNHFIKKIKGEN